MRKFCSLFILLLPLINYAQEKITDVHEPSYFFSDIYYEKDGKKYFANWNNGTVRLTEYNNKSQVEIAKIEMAYPIFKGYFLLSIEKTGLVTYNLKTKELKRFPFSNEYEFYRFYILEDSKAVLKANILNTDYPKYFICDFDTGITDSPSNFGTPLAISGPYVIYHSWSNILPEYNRYTLINMNNFEKVVLVDNTKYSTQFSFIEDKIWFYDAFKFAKSYSISEKKYQSYISLTLAFEPSKQRFFIKDSLLISLVTANLKNSVKTYNLNSNKVVNEYNKIGGDTKQWYIEDFNLLDSCIVTSNVYSELVKYDFKNGEMKVFPASLSHDFIYELPRLKIKDKSVQYFKDKLYLIDLKNNEIDSFNWTLPKLSSGYSYLSYYNSDIIYEDDNEMIVNFEIANNYENFNQIIINKQSKKITEVFLNSKFSGFAGQGNQLFEVNDELVAVGKNVYHIKDNNTVRLNDGPLHLYDQINKNAVIKVEDGIRFYEADGDDLILYQFDGKNKYSIDTFYHFNTVKPYKFIYFENKFFYTKYYILYYTDGKSTKEISPFDYYYDELIIHDNALYFHKNKVIYKLQNDVLTPIGTVQHNNFNFYKTNDHLYIRGDGVNYEILNDNIIHIANADNSYFTELDLKLSNGSSLASYSEGLANIKDQNFIPLFKDSLRMVDKYGDLGLLRRFGKTRLMNLKTAEWTDLPTIPDGRAIGISVSQYDTLIYSIHDLEREIRISKLVNLKGYVPIYSKNGFFNLDYFFDIGGPSHHQLVLMDGILLSIDQNSTIDMKVDFNTTKNYNGIPTFTFVKDHIYFFSNNDESGVQVYSFYTGASTIEDLIEKKLDVCIYPNPAQDLITIKTPFGDIVEFDFVIYDMKGGIVDSGNNNKEQIIRVHNLEPGAYILCIITKDGISHTTFVKI